MEAVLFINKYICHYFKRYAYIMNKCMCKRISVCCMVFSIFPQNISCFVPCYFAVLMLLLLVYMSVGILLMCICYTIAVNQLLNFNN